MSEADPKYRAFLSYSHSDTRVARRVHAYLEGFQIDKDLIGRPTAGGPIPTTLRPIFRDRSDFDAGTSLGEQTIRALDASAALILLASPHAAKSHFVNEEVRLFRARHSQRPVIPLIVAAGSGNIEQECFPPALRFTVTTDGVVGDTPSSILAADLREIGDGRELALAKVVARLIFYATDDVYRRANRERRRRTRLRSAFGIMTAGLAIFGGLFFWQSYQKGITLAEIDGLVAKYSARSSLRGPVLDSNRSLTDAITAIAEGSATDPRYAAALTLLNAGKAAEAEPLLKSVAEERAKRADKDAKDAAAAYRTLASIAGVSDPRRARQYYAEAARLDPADVRGMAINGALQGQAGNGVAGEAADRQVINMAKHGNVDDFSLFLALVSLHMIERSRRRRQSRCEFQGWLRLTGRCFGLPFMRGLHEWTQFTIAWLVEIAKADRRGSAHAS